MREYLNVHANIDTRSIWRSIIARIYPAISKTKCSLTIPELHGKDSCASFQKLNARLQYRCYTGKTVVLVFKN